MGIFNRLRNRSQPVVLSDFNKYLRFNARLAEAKSYESFIFDCVEKNQYPTDFWKSIKRNHIRPNARTLKRHAQNVLETLRTNIVETERLIMLYRPTVENIEPDELAEFDQYVSLICAQTRERKRLKLLKGLSSELPSTKFPSNPERYVHNYSSVQLSKLQLEALSLGPKFCHNQPKASQIDIETQFENLMKQCHDLQPTSERSVEIFKSALVYHCNYYNSQMSSTSNILSKKHKDSVKELLNNTDLLLSRPDKGAGWVIMEKSNYIEKLETILADPAKFQCIPHERDQTAQIESRMVQLLKSLKNRNLLPQTLYNQLIPTGSQPPRLYGLPKVHKPNLPLRPVIDMSSSPYHAVAQWIVHLLEPVRKCVSKYSVKDTFDFVQTIDHVNASESSLISLDVESLFTNVPLIETVDFICETMTNHQIDVGIPLADLKELILRCTFDIQFLFNGKFYRQRDGIAMGSPLGPVLADIFMSKLETTVLKDIIEKLKIYRRYIDDTFILCDNRLNTMELLETFNSSHPRLKFTLETEQNNYLPFLDVGIHKTPTGELLRSVHRKATWVGQYTHFASFVPIKYKRNLVSCLAYRARKICSPGKLNEELKFINRFLLDNGYPERFIKKHIQPKHTAPAKYDVPKKTLFLRVPYKGDKSYDILRLRLSKSIRETFPSAQLCLLPTTKPFIVQCNKDKLPRQSESFILYQFTCSCGAQYIGHTTRRLSQRIKEHYPASLRKGTVRTLNSAILEHLFLTNHYIEVNKSFKVLYQTQRNLSKATRKQILMISEAISIRILKPELCKQRKLIHPLSLPWSQPIVSQPHTDSTSNTLHTHTASPSLPALVDRVTRS